MSKKCEHIEDCDDCSSKIPEKDSESVSRVTQILRTIESRTAALEIAISNENRFKISIEHQAKEHRKAVEDATLSLSQARIQLDREISKFTAMPEAANA